MKEEPRTEILKYLDNNLYLEQSADKLRNWESEYYGGILEFQIVNDELYFIYQVVV